jgi:hypothetical protein
MGHQFTLLMDILEKDLLLDGLLLRLGVFSPVTRGEVFTYGERTEGSFQLTNSLLWVTQTVLRMSNGVQQLGRGPSSLPAVSINLFAYGIAVLERLTMLSILKMHMMLTSMFCPGIS